MKLTHKLIARITPDLKDVRFFLSGGHHASCFPHKPKSSMTTNLYRYLSGEINSFNGAMYFYVDVEGLHLDEACMERLKQRVKEMAIAKLNPPK